MFPKPQKHIFTELKILSQKKIYFMRKNALTFLLFLTAVCLNSQSYLGYLTDNYKGVHGVISNPSSIVDSRYRTDINLIGVSAFAGNDAFGLDPFNFFKDYTDAQDAREENSEISDFDIFDSLTESYLTDDNNFGANVDILGPSFMFNINSENSIALFSRVRAFVNLNKLAGSTYDIIRSGEDITIINEDDVFVNASAWTEIGATYARVLKNDAEHFLKGGLSLKYMRGGGVYANGADLVLEIDDENTTELDTGTTISTVTVSGEGSYAVPVNIDELEDYEFSDYLDLSRDFSTFGIDLGFTYEWRPDHKNYMTTNAKGETNYDRGKNKYKLKLGLSITDLGLGGFKHDNGYSEGFTFNFDSTEIEDIDELDGILDEAYETTTIEDFSYKFNLPTALHFNADYNINDKFYVNLNTDFSLVSKEQVGANSISNLVSLTPRFESKWLSFYVPLSMVQYSGFRAGAGLRAGPIYIGSGSILTNLFSDYSKGADVYAGFKIPIYHGKTKDKDNDGIEDKLDACPKEAGPQENNGCPWGDEDGDGVLDNEDKCIKTAGPKENNGCPWGDKDNDGVLDNVDKCPEVPGVRAYEGCPADEDKDGILDQDDKCPKEAGPKENNGCPWGDADGDGVLDNVDKCPNQPGVATRQGCPEPKVVAPIEEEKLKELQSFAKAIYFNSGKATFRPGVTDKLDLIADIMKEYPNANFNIEGHTDSQGAATTNQSLSDRRARAVLNYLISRGITSSRLSSYGYGEEYPIADNATRDGRAQNRRVEIRLRK